MVNIEPVVKPRQLVLSSEINQATVGAMIEKIIEINEDDAFKEATYVGFKREPIMLFINTNGGCAYDALALIDIIKASKTPVYTIALGWTMSAGLWIFIHGKKRFVGKNATLMYHDVSSWAVGKTQEMVQETMEAQRLSELLVKQITENSIIEEDDLADYIARKADWYITAEEAIDFGLADGYYK